MTGEIKDKVALPGDIALLAGNVKNDFPSGRIQKGLVLTIGNKDLSEEGVGFGVPVLKFGNETIFPGRRIITSTEKHDETIVKVDYDMNLVERMAIKGRKKISGGTFYKIKEVFSRLHREHPGLRRIITHASIELRHAFNVDTIFEEASSAGIVSVLYLIRPDSGMIEIKVDPGMVKKKGCSELIFMNEQGASYFDRYQDSNGTVLTGIEIGTWDETFADEASFIDLNDNIKFTLNKVKGSRMFRGREYVKDRLAWSGLAYVIPPVDFAYSIKIGGCR